MTTGTATLVLYRRKEECCGCTACYAACPKGAIAMVPDTEGFEYPRIDPGKCVLCGSCIRVCPMRAAKGARKDRREP